MTGPLRMRRQMSPQDWTSTSVSRPRTVVVVYFGSPERTCLQTSELFPGCVVCRCCCALMGSSGSGPGPCWASATVVPASKASAAKPYLRLPITRTPLTTVPALLADALVLVLGELPVLDLIFPARAVPLVPLAAAQLDHGRIVVPRSRVGLALVLALLVDDDLLLLAAGNQTEGNQNETGNKNRPHDFFAGCCCICAGGLA